jgi:hypothetical protein
VKHGIGTDGDTYLEKFVTNRPGDVERFPENVRGTIRRAVAKVRMTKEQVSIALWTPPT